MRLGDLILNVAVLVGLIVGVLFVFADGLKQPPEPEHPAPKDRSRYALNLDLFVQAVTADNPGTYERARAQLTRHALEFATPEGRADAARFLDYLEWTHPGRFVISETATGPRTGT